jgi:hypothetical protein
VSERRIRLPVENCPRWFKFLCPKTWSQFDRTSQLDVRFCQSCRKNVYYCDSEEAVEEHRQAGHCICVEVSVGDDDLDTAEFLGV